MTTAAPSIKSTAKHTPATASYKPIVRLTAHRGWYRVQSGTTPSVYYDTTANSCTCPARKPCRHMRFVRSLNVAFFARKEAQAPEAPVEIPAVMPMPVSGSLDAALAEAERVLTIKSRALAETDHRSDDYATLLREVNQAERQVAAANYAAMRAA